MNKIFYLILPLTLLLFGCAKEEGCTDPIAYNFNIDAEVDDGLCIYDGCIDPTAYNYNAIATIDDGSCFFVGNLLFYFDSDIVNLLPSTVYFDLLTTDGNWFEVGSLSSVYGGHIIPPLCYESVNVEIIPIELNTGLPIVVEWRARNWMTVTPTIYDYGSVNVYKNMSSTVGVDLL